MTFRDTSADITLDNANMGTREDFEKWAKEKDRFVPGICDGKYLDAFTSTAYRAWQARQPEIDALKAENERLREAIPKTPESMMSFIGSHFSGMRTADDKGQTYTDLSRIEYSLTIHDLLSAFSWAGLGPEEIDAAMKDFSTTKKEE